MKQLYGYGMCLLLCVMDVHGAGQERKVQVAQQETKGVESKRAAAQEKQPEEWRLDTDFGDHGFVTMPYEEGTTIAVQGNFIIVFGRKFNGRGWDWVVERRFVSNGMVDKSFGKNGQVILPVYKDDVKIENTAVQPDGVIIYGRFKMDGKWQWGLVRYLLDGRIDKSFGKNGFVVRSSTSEGSCIPTDLSKEALALLQNGFFLSGFNERNVFRPWEIWRYTLDGKIDTHFGKSGSLTFENHGFKNLERKVFALQDGSIIIITAEGLARYTSQGNLDKAFDVVGKRIFYGQPGVHSIDAVILQPQGFVVGGSNRVNHQWGIMRFTLNGILDTHFGKNGYLIQQFYGDARIENIVPTHNGIIVTGSTVSNGKKQFVIARYHDYGTYKKEIRAAAKAPVTATKVGGMLQEDEALRAKDEEVPAALRDFYIGSQEENLPTIKIPHNPAIRSIIADYLVGPESGTVSQQTVEQPICAPGDAKHAMAQQAQQQETKKQVSKKLPETQMEDVD